MNDTPPPYHAIDFAQRRDAMADDPPTETLAALAVPALDLDDEAPPPPPPVPSPPPAPEWMRGNVAERRELTERRTVALERISAALEVLATAARRITATFDKMGTDPELRATVERGAAAGAAVSEVLHEAQQLRKREPS